MSPSLSGIGRGSGMARIPKVHRETQFPQPPKGIPNPTRKPIHPAGPGEPPKGFINGNRSIHEWYWFWALMKRLGPPGETWGYQIGIGDGAATIDFVIWDREPRLAMRIQTPFFHVAVDATRKLFDETQRDILEALGYHVVDVYSEEYIDDPSGIAVLAYVDEVLSGYERPNPIWWGISITRAT